MYLNSLLLPISRFESSLKEGDSSFIWLRPIDFWDIFIRFSLFSYRMGEADACLLRFGVLVFGTYNSLMLYMDLSGYFCDLSGVFSFSLFPVCFGELNEL